MAGVHKEVWTGIVEKRFRDDMAGSHLSGVRDFSKEVKDVGGARVIHLVALGADPQVFIDNTTYPISTVNSADSDILIQLKKLDTENTRITDDELQGISYDKIGVKAEQHEETLYDKCVALANHSLAPQTHNADRPIVLTTGAERDGEGRKKLTPKDITKLKKLWDKKKFPKKGRRLVLCPDHIQDLLDIDEKFEKQYKDNREGVVLRMYGFEIYEEVDMPIYQGTTGDASTMQKQAFGAAANATDDRVASFAYVARNVGKAETGTKMYHSKAEEDPDNRESKIGFRKYSVYTNLRNESFSAIVDDKTA